MVACEILTTEHHRHLDQNADHGGERRAGFEAEQADRGRDGEFEEVACADQGGRRGDAVRLAEPAIEQVGEPRTEVDLDQDGHREQQDHQGLPQDLLALGAEQQDQGREQGDQRDRLQAREQLLQRVPAAGDQGLAAQMRDDHRDHDDRPTERTRVSQGTMIADKPSSSPTIGAKANTGAPGSGHLEPRRLGERPERFESLLRFPIS